MYLEIKDFLLRNVLVVASSIPMYSVNVIGLTKIAARPEKLGFSRVSVPHLQHSLASAGL